MLKTGTTQIEMEGGASVLDVEEEPLDTQVRQALASPGLANVEHVAGAQIALAIELAAVDRILAADGEDRSCAAVPLDGGDGEADGSRVDWVCDSYS